MPIVPYIGMNTLIKKIRNFNFLIHANVFAPKTDQHYIDKLINDKNISTFIQKIKLTFSDLNINKQDIKEWYDKNEDVLRSFIQFPLFNNNKFLFASFGNMVYILTNSYSSDPERIIESMSDYKDHNATLNKEILIKPTDKVPIFYLYKLTTAYRGYETNITKNLMHYHFLVLFLESLGIKDHDILYFINKNKDQIHKLMSKFKFVPKHLGGGEDGEAFDIGNGMVLKLFKSDASYQSSLRTQRMLHSGKSVAKTEPMIYDVGILGYYTNRYGESMFPIYYQIMEKMNPLPKDIEKELSLVIQEIRGLVSEAYFMNDNFKQIALAVDDGEPIENFSHKINQLLPAFTSKVESLISKNYYDRILKINKTLSLHNDWLELLIEEFLIKKITRRTDLHSGNIGITNNGQLRYFDPQYPWK